ncbi:MAG: glycosyltransferase [Verrucomicrobiota bacterium]|jgi:GT2 family glycosyltransferase/tetratricopeptide (TPR) repeat protein/glycosyltransferase involved in cell wall biosynthesis
MTAAKARPARVCIASQEFVGPTRNGGIGASYTALAQSLAAAGHQVTCLYVGARRAAPAELQPWVETYKRDAIALVPLPEIKTPALDGPDHVIRSFETYDWLRRNDRFDVIHFPDWQGPGYFTLLAKHQRLAFGRSTICVGLRSMTIWLKTANQEFLGDLAELELDFMERQSVALADVVISPSHFLLNWISRRDWELPAHCLVQQNILPQSARLALPPAPGRAREITELVFFGRLQTSKGVALFCDALDRLPPVAAGKIQSVSFLGGEATVDGIPARDYLQKRAQPWPWKTDIISDRNQIQALEFLRQPHRLAIIPSLLDNSPNTVCECLGAQIPFAASRVGGIPELIAPDDLARVCFDPNPNALCSLLSRALTDGFSPARPALEPRANELAWTAWHQSLAAAGPDSPATAPLPPRWPKVSICLTTFDRPALLRQAMASIQSLSYANLEVVLVDDGSTQTEALDALDQLQPAFDQRGWLIIRRQNRHLGAARNTAARHATGDFLLFMDDNDFAEPTEISTLVTAALRTGADIVVCGMNCFEGCDAPNASTAAKSRCLPLGGPAAVGAFRNCFGDANALVRRSCFDNLGGFTEDDVLTREDWEFHARAVLRGFKLTVVPEFLFWRRLNPDATIGSASQFHNHARGIRPYLAAVPAALQPLVQLARGQQMLLAKTAALAFQANDGPLVVAWRSKLEAARIFAKQNQNDTATRLLVEAVKSVENSRHPPVILDALLNVGSEMRALDPARAAHLLRLACDLAKAVGNEPARQAAAALMASLPGRTPVAAELPPLVSIVIPIFNKINLTRQCLRALIANTPAPRHEIIAVDNASTDGTPAFLRSEESAGRLRVILNPENVGFARACNQGARAARGKYVVFLGNDTEPQSNWLGALFSLAEADPKIAAVGAKLLFPDGTLQHAGVALADCKGHDPLLAFHPFAKEKSDFPLSTQRRVYQAVAAACMLARKSHFDQAGGFDEQYWNGYEDVDLCLRFQQRGWLSVYEPASVVIYHESQSGPEQFPRVSENVQRFHQKWLEKASTDVIIDENGKCGISPASPMRLYAPPPGKLVSIIILAHNQLADTRQCLAAIEKHTPLAHELILVDNGSTDGAGQFFRQYAAKRQNVRVILNRPDLGVSAGNNLGLACAKGDALLLLSNQAVVTAGWLERMLSVLELYPDCGLVGPVSNSVSGPQLLSTANYSSLEELSKFALHWSASHAGQSAQAPRLVGFCLLLRRAVLDKIGGLDPQLGSANFQDDDFCMRAALAGFNLRIAVDSFVHLTGNQTSKAAKIDPGLARNWEVFKAKWGLPSDASPEKACHVPSAAPAGLTLQLPLPDLSRSHASSLGGRLWIDKMLPQAMRKKTPRNAPALVLPPCALAGHLGQAREIHKNNDWAAAWQATTAAISARPHHPEAYLLLAEIALATNDAEAARLCARHACGLAPGWAPPKQFPHHAPRGNPRPEWLKLPPALLRSAAPRLTVCLIAKNEEKFLAQCLRSVRPLASQIIVVDTGSTDRTVQIAAEHGAEVHHFAWCDDFSAARNAALEHATGDWVLVLDADEELMPGQAEVLAREIQASDIMGYRLPIIDIGREQDGCSYVMRLFRNAPGLFFVGRVHEQVFSSVYVRCQQWKLKHQLGNARLLHHGYTAALVAARNKPQRNLRLLERAVQELPDEPNLLMSLGLELARCGQSDAAIDRYWEAFHLLSTLPAQQVMPELRETLLTQLSTRLMAAKRHSDLVHLWQIPFANAGGLTASQHFNLGLAHLHLNQPAEAAEQLRLCVAKRGLPALSPINAGILRAGPNHCLALCLTALNQPDAARQAFEAALADEPSSRPARFDFARFHAAQGRPVDALKLLNQLASENPADAPVWLLGGRIALNRPECLEFARNWTGEAVKNFPQNPAILLLRAEALLLSQEAARALPLWRQAHSPGSARHRAAIVLCELLVGDRQHHFLPAEEPAISQEAVHWYRQWIRVGAHSLVSQLHQRMDQARLVLPGFAGVCEAAHRQARRAAA